MKIINTNLSGLLVVETRTFEDVRGFFLETWNQTEYSKQGLQQNFVQDNLSFSRKGVLRGMHFQNPHPQGKLVYVIQGEVFDVAVDLRLGSPTFGKHFSIILNSENKKQLYVPEGFAHGFVTLSETALFAYKCTNTYNPSTEHSLLWNDPDVNINWPIEKPNISPKDGQARLLKDIPQSVLLPYNEATQ